MVLGYPRLKLNTGWSTDTSIAVCKNSIISMFSDKQ